MNRKVIAALVALSAALLSIPWLVPHTGVLALVGFVPLLCAEYIATGMKAKHFFWWYFLAFLLWNGVTTFWVCNATVAGGIFAGIANALQMSVVFALFRWGRRRLPGVLPYVLLAAAWIAWERFYYNTEISWPWLVLGGAFARSTASVQWYSVTGTLGGSLWIWLSNLGIFGMMVAIAEGRARRWTPFARIAAPVALLLVIFGPMAASAVMNAAYEEVSEGKVDVLIAQPDFDPYNKFEAMTQAEQNAVLLDLCKFDDDDAPDLILAPETFTSDVWLNDVESSATVRTFRSFIDRYPGLSLLTGVSAHRFSPEATSPLSWKSGGGWIDSYNSALMLGSGRAAEIFHKSKLVVGTELTPYPAVFIPLERLICRISGMTPPLMGRCQGQKDISLLHLQDGTPLGCAVCYESVYGEYCTGYVRKGAKAMTVITNDAWWGDTPGYRQHLSYSSLRAIELRRDIARCGNTGISAIIDQKGRILSETEWWKPATLRGELNLNSRQSVFVRTGDVVGRAATFLFLLLLLLLLVQGVRKASDVSRRVS